MKIERTRKQTPRGSSPSDSASREAEERERFVWEALVPRLLHPSKLAVMKALLEQGQPMTVSELAEAVEITEEHARYQCKSMQKAGVLEVASVAARMDSEVDESSYYFPEPQQVASSSLADSA